MKILAIDTATEACSAALLYDNAISERYQIAPQQHTQLILPMLQELLQEAGITLHQLDAIAFGRGPGSFTGLRIAHSVTQALAYAANLPVLPISNLLALAQTAAKQLKTTTEHNLLCALDARMQEIYWACYQLKADQTLIEVTAETVSAPTKITLPITTKWIGVGSGFVSYPFIQQQFTDQPLQIMADCYPRASAIAKLAAQDFQQKKAIAATAAIPIYLRNQVTHQVR